MNKDLMRTVVLVILFAIFMPLSIPSSTIAQTCPNCTDAPSAGKNVGRDFFVQVVGRLKDVPLNDFAVDALVAWQPYEGTNACWNPLATTWKMETVCNFNSVGVQNYQDQDMGVRATANTLNLGYYDAIRKMLRLEAMDREGIRTALGTWGTCHGQGCDSLLNKWQGLWNPLKGPTGFRFCASETQRCSFSGVKDVAYGANDKFYYRNRVTDGIDCNNDMFGDPNSGVLKACYTKDSEGVLSYKGEYVAQSYKSPVRTGERQTAWIDLRNTGTGTWDSSTLLAVPEDSQTGEFYCPSWISKDRIASVTPAQVQPGEVGRFQFELCAPSTAGQRKLDFIWAQEGVKYFSEPQKGWIWFEITVEAANCYTLTVDANPDNAGTVTVDPAPNCGATTASPNIIRASTTTLAQYQYAPNTVVTLMATANLGYGFGQWSGDATGNTNPTTITLNANKNVVANFAPVCYTLTTNVSPAGSGSINVMPSPNCNGTQYTAGTPVWLTATPNANYKFKEWSGNLSGNENPAPVTMDGAKNITAIFAPIIHGPARVNASDGTFASHVLVDWSPIANATGYNVYRNTTENNCDMATRIATTNRIMRYEDRTALPGVTYWYWVTALTSQGESDRCPSPNDAGFRAANWQSEAVNWRVDYDNNWIRGATVTKPGATNIRVHLSAISMGAGDHLRTTTQDDWTGYSTDVTSKATVDKNSIGIVLVSDASGTGYFVIDRVEFQGTSAGPATWAGELAQGVVTPTRTPTWTPTPWIPPTPTATFTLPVPPLPPTFTPTVPPSGQLQPTRTPTVKPGATVPSTTIVMANKTFTPANLRIARGTQVMWLNTDKTATYKIVSGTSLRRTTLFASGALPPGAVFKFTFTTPGIYTYFDETLGAQMQGTITVQ